MKSWKVGFDCEAKERTLTKKLIGSNLAAESVVLTFTVDGEEEMRETPYVFIPDLKFKVIQLLEQNDE